MISLCSHGQTEQIEDTVLQNYNVLMTMKSRNIDHFYVSHYSKTLIIVSNIIL